MKKLLLLLVLFTANLGMIAQQVDRDYVLLEIGTGTWCVYCPGAAMGADDLIENGHPVVVVENHNGDAFANVYSNTRNNYYNIGGFPTAYFDGSYNEVVGGSSSQSLYTTYLPIVNSRIAIQSDYSVEIYGDNQGDLYNITLHVNKHAEYSGNMVVHLALTESHIPVSWHGMSEVNFVNRLMVPSQNGTPIDMNVGEEQDIELSFTFNNSWDIEHCELAAWIQDNSNKEVMNSTKVKLTELEPSGPTFLADFEADITEVCETGYVSFNNMVIGDPISYHWEFPGGFPAESWDENPEIWYGLSLGVYDVTLTISDGINTSTVTKEDYITVEEPLGVDFAEVDVQCIFWDPWQLTQGSPEGGIYEGEGVYLADDNTYYFDPELAGAGDHMVMYKFDDICESHAEANITVDFCTGVEETVNGISVSVHPNPSSGIVTLDLSSDSFKSAQIRVFNAVGAEVYRSANVHVSGLYSHRIDLTDMPKGLYFVNIESEDALYNQKIILQ